MKLAAARATTDVGAMNKERLGAIEKAAAAVMRGEYHDQFMVDWYQGAPARGPCAWEIVTHFTYIDLDSKAIAGGKFWRFTTMVNWYLTDNVRLEMAYGYSATDRFGLTGKTHFFQSRLQLLI